MQQAFLYLDTDMEKGILHPLATGRVGVYSRSAPDKTSGNEDGLALFSQKSHGVILAVADGMGGHRSGALAARLTLEALIKSLSECKEDAVFLREAILSGIEQANQSVMELGVAAGATLCVAVVLDEMVTSYHVGDSLILITSNRGTLKFQNMAHSPVGYLLEAGHLSESEALQHEHRHVVSNYIGSQEMHIEVGPAVPMAAYDTLLLATDGVSDNLHTDEIIQCVRKGRLESAMKHVVKRCRERMQHPSGEEPSKPDDLSLILFRQNRNK